MSKRVVVICLLLCLAGFVFGWGLSGLLMAAVHGQAMWGAILYQTAGFLSLPAGVGMLMGYRWGRTLAVVAFAVGYVTSAAMLVAPLLPDGFVHLSISGHPVVYGVFATNALLLLGVLLLLHWTLYTPSFEDHLS